MLRADVCSLDVLEMHGSFQEVRLPKVIPLWANGRTEIFVSIVDNIIYIKIK